MSSFPRLDLSYRVRLGFADVLVFFLSKLSDSPPSGCEAHDPGPPPAKQIRDHAAVAVRTMGHGLHVCFLAGWMSAVAVVRSQYQALALQVVALGVNLFFDTVVERREFSSARAATAWALLLSPLVGRPLLRGLKLPALSKVVLVPHLGFLVPASGLRHVSTVGLGFMLTMFLKNMAFSWLPSFAIFGQTTFVAWWISEGPLETFEVVTSSLGVFLMIVIYRMADSLVDIFQERKKAYYMRGVRRQQLIH